MRQDSAHILALRVLGWLADRRDLLDGFLAASGASVDDLRASADNPALLCGVLDHLMLEDWFVLDCAADLDVAPEDIVAARAVLGRGDQRHWT